MKYVIVHITEMKEEDGKLGCCQVDTTTYVSNVYGPYENERMAHRLARSLKKDRGLDHGFIVAVLEES